MIKGKQGRIIKFGVEIVAFNSIDYLEAIIRMFQPFVDKIVVSTGEKSWNGNVENNGEVEKTVSLLVEEFENVNLVKGNWKTAAEQRNATLRHLGECGYIFIVDADELWTSGDINNVKSFVLHHLGYKVFRANFNTRFKNINWRVESREMGKPVVVIGRDMKFVDNREIEATPASAGILIPEKTAIVEHFSYVRSDDLKIKEKIKTFSDANEIVNGADFWYENVYLEANLDSKFLHPTNPECYDHLVEDGIDPEILKFLKKYSLQLFNEK